MNVRATLSHATLGSAVVLPDGWKETKLRLERDEDFHSLIEYLNVEFIFFGNDGTHNGGVDFIRSALLLGFDDLVTIVYEVSFDDITWPLSFSGTLDLENSEEMADNKIKCPVLRDDVWSKFISRFDTPVDIQSTADLDGNAVDPTQDVDIQMESQTIVYSSDFRGNESFTYPTSGSTLAAYITLAWYNQVIDDIPINGAYLKENNFNNIATTFFAPWDGEYRIQIRFSFSKYDTMSDSWILPDSTTHFYIIKSGTSAVQLTRTSVGTSGDEAYEYTYDNTLFMNAGERVTVYGDDNPSLDQSITILGEVRWRFGASAMAATTGNITLSGEQTIDGYSAVATDRVLVKDQNNKAENGLYTVSAGAWSRTTGYDTTAIFNLLAIYVANGTINGDTYWKQTQTDVVVGVDPIIWEFMFPSEERFEPYEGHDVENYIKITAETIYQDTQSAGFLIHDTAAGIVNRIVGENQFYSEYLGSDQTTERQYLSDGCAWTYMLLKGLQVRGYTLSEKPFFMSFKEWWEGANPILNLGIGYEEMDNSNVFRVEEKEHFYADETPVVNFSYVRSIVKTYDQNKIFNKIEIGYQKWESEDTSGIDDPQTKKVYATRFQRSGQTIQLHSRFIAASLAIEATRRKSIIKSSDYKFDNDTFIISINPVISSPERYLPELDENFDSVSNLNTPESRYNLRLTPARNMLRWLIYLNGCLQSYLSSVYRFVSGEGNYDCITEMDVSDCDENFGGDPLSEKQDLSPSTEFIHLPDLYEIEIDMSYEEYLLIRNNRKKPIGISQTGENHTPFYIKDLEYAIFESKAVVSAWAKEAFQLVVPEDEVINECDAPYEDQLPSPASIIFSDVDFTSMTISWSSVSRANSYSLERATQSDFSDATQVYLGAGIEFDDSGLDSDTTYYYRVSADAVGYRASEYTSGQQATLSTLGIGWSSETTPARQWRSICFGDEFVSVASSGTGDRIMYSSDGETWTLGSSSVDNEWTGITWGLVYVAVSQTGTGDRIMTATSPASTWTSRTSPADNDWQSVAYLSGVGYAAVANTGSGDRAMFSSNGTTGWSTQSCPDDSWSSIAAGAGIFCAVASAGAGTRVMTSPDGTTWTARTPSIAGVTWRKVVFVNGLFIATGSLPPPVGRMMYSTDGITWNTGSIPTLIDVFGYANNLYLAYSRLGSGDRIYTSPDLSTWTSRDTPDQYSWVDGAVNSLGTIAVAISVTSVTDGVLKSPSS